MRGECSWLEQCATRFWPNADKKQADPPTHGHLPEGALYTMCRGAPSAIRSLGCPSAKGLVGVQQTTRYGRERGGEVSAVLTGAGGVSGVLTEGEEGEVGSVSVELTGERLAKQWL